MKQTKEVKKYKLTWIDDEANFHHLGTVVTNNPIHALFDKVCEMIVQASFFYDPKKGDGIIKDIKKREGEREFYFYEANDHTLTIMEA